MSQTATAYLAARSAADNCATGAPTAAYTRALWVAMTDRQRAAFDGYADFDAAVEALCAADRERAVMELERAGRAA